jgi:uncharacterized protein YigA (DUF484 family)
MVLDKLGVLSYDGKAIGYCVLEICSKVPMGFILVGAREANEGASTFAGGLAMMLRVTSDAAHQARLQRLRAGAAAGGATPAAPKAPVLEGDAAAWLQDNPAFALHLASLIQEQQLQQQRSPPVVEP